MASFGIRGMNQNFGIKICCCRVCTCINFGFISSRAGLLKILQLALATLCEGLLINYGIPAAATIGQALISFLTTTAYCFTTTVILMICYCFSEKSYGLIRQSLFEVETQKIKKAKQNVASFGIRGRNQNLAMRICCCRLCTYINFEFIGSLAGLLKILQLALATLCKWLLINYGILVADTIGQALTRFLTTTGFCFTTTAILMFCYCLSKKYCALIRHTLFETLFNAVACSMYFSASSYMGFACVVWLHPQFLIKPGFWAYPAMTAAYYMGYAAGILHGIDAYLAFKHFKGFR